MLAGSVGGGQVETSQVLTPTPHVTAASSGAAVHGAYIVPVLLRTSCSLLRGLFGSVQAFLFIFFLLKNTQVFPRVD